MNKFWKWAALSCAGMMSVFMLAGCGEGGGENQALPDAKTESSAADTENAEKRMGRYLENEITVPEDIKTTVSYPAPYLQKSENNELVLAEPMTGRYLSADMGEKWEQMDCPWRDRISGAYISDVALSPDGAAAMIYSPYEDSDGNPDGGEETDISGDESGETDQASTDMVWKAVYFDADGNEAELDFPETGDARAWKLAFDRQGGLYAFDFERKVYRLDPAAGTKKELFDTEGLMDFVCFTDRYMVGFTTRGEVVIYDMEQDEPAPEDRILQDFVSENLGDSLGGMERGHELVATAGEQEDIIYFAFRGGV